MHSLICFALRMQKVFFKRGIHRSILRNKNFLFLMGSKHYKLCILQKRTEKVPKGTFFYSLYFILTNKLVLAKLDKQI